jgi:SEC-C motif-containing protein
MRARFAAYALADDAYLLNSWHPSTRPPGVTFDPELRWLGLEILDTEGGGLLDNDGEVEFIARYRRDSREGSLQERSRFVRANRRWTYLDAADADLT